MSWSLLSSPHLSSGDLVTQHPPEMGHFNQTKSWAGAGLGWAPCRVCHNTDTSKTPTSTSRPLVFPFFNWIQKISNRVIFLLQLEARVWKIGAGEDGNATALCHGEMNARPGRALFGCNLQCYSDENCALLSRIILHSFVRDNCSYAKVSQIFHHKNEDCISLIWE